MRKKILAWMMGPAVALTAYAVFAEEAVHPFQGEVDYKLSSKSINVETHYFIKGDKIRVDSQNANGETSMIMDLKLRQIAMLSPQQKTYFLIPLSDNKKGGGGAPHKTGKTDVILGKKCEEWRMEGGNGRVILWAVSGMGSLITPNDGSPSGAWATVAKEKGLFPLRIIYQDDKGKLQTTQEATNIVEKTPDEGLFEIPDGYQKIEMSVPSPAAQATPAKQGQKK